MYYKDIESSREAKKQHDIAMKAAASKRLGDLAQKRKHRKVKYATEKEQF